MFFWWTLLNGYSHVLLNCLYLIDGFLKGILEQSVVEEPGLQNN